jgi:large conductance mechanosensitive channel
MKKLMKEFREFLNSGDFVTVAIGLVMALYVKVVIDAIMDGVINPIIAAIVGKPDLSAFGFKLGKARISLGLVISGLIQFVLVGFILFMIIRAYNKFRNLGRHEDPPGTPPETELQVLRDIREALRNR